MLPHFMRPPGFEDASGYSIVRHPDASPAREKKSVLDREADRWLAAARCDHHAAAIAEKPARRMYGKLQQVWPVVLEARNRGESVAAIARQLHVKPHTIAYHLASRKDSAA